MKLRTKLVIPVFTILIILGVISALFTRAVVSDITEYVYQLSENESKSRIKKSAETSADTIINDINRISNKAIAQSLVFSNYPSVLEAYKIAYTGNINDENDPVVKRARNMLKKRLKPIVSRYLDVTSDGSFRLHYHLSNNHSFARIWRDGWQVKRNGKKVDISDNLSSFRHTVVQINQGDHTPVHGIEVGRGGFVIRGLTPVIGPDGQHYGSCEVYFSFNNVLRHLPKDDKKYYAFYMDERLLATATSMRDEKRFPVLDNKYVLSSSTRSTLTSPLITSTFLDEARHKSHSMIIDHFDLTGTPIQDFSGKTVGVAVLVQDISTQLKSLEDTRQTGENARYAILWKTTIGVFVAIILIFILYSILIRKVVVNPLDKCLHFADRISDGDLTVTLDIQKKDEIGQLVIAFQKIVDSFSGMIQHISSDIVQLSSNSNELSSISQQVLSGAELAAEKAQSVATATEKSSTNMNTIAATSEQASISLSETSDKISHMTTTINDIAQNSKRANTISDRAVELVSSASSKVDTLGTAAKEIDKVTEVITGISSKTDLLALNATVEAARAGEAGKGFAVVASEIKALANRTDDSTKEIQQKIRDIQDSTIETAEEIKQIESVISEVHDIIFSISTSVNEQASTTEEIADNMGHATVGINEVAQNIVQSSIVINEIASDINGVSQATSEFSSSSNQITDSAEELSSIAKSLKKVLERFKTDMNQVKDSNNSSTVSGAVQSATIVPLMKWDNSFMIHVPEVDQQHKRLLELVNQLHAAMKLRKDDKELGDILNGLSEYTATHFSYEEKIMQQAGYRDLSSHQELHKGLIVQLSEFKAKFESGDAMISMELMDFLKDWLTNHIKGTDKQYATTVIEWQNQP